jgi:uncharacterized protein YecE (DUF72 family)
LSVTCCATAADREADPVRLVVGTSGYSYKEWKGSFYPEELPAKQMLSYYSTRLPAVEINNTFYRLPRETVLEGWAATTEDRFLFSIKASRRITHFRRLRGVEELVQYLLDTVQVLGAKLGPLLFQLPPNFKRDDETLGGFLDLLPPRCRAAFEFRHDSWFDDEVYRVLSGHGNASLVASDRSGVEAPPVVATADWGYLRLRRTNYRVADLKPWAARVREQPWQDAFVFFKHEETAGGPELAQRFADLFEAS